MSKKRFLLCFMLLAFAFGSLEGIRPYNGPLLRMHTASATLIGLAMSMYGFITVIGNPFFGHRSDRTWTRLGRRMPYVWVMVPGTIALLALMPLSPTYLVLLLNFTAQAFFASVGIIPLYSMIPDNVPAEERGSVIAAFSITGGIGAVVMIPTCAYLWKVSPPYAFYAAAAFSAVFVIPSLFGLKERPFSEQELAEARSRGEAGNIMTYLRGVLSEKPVMIFLQGSFFRVITWAVLMSYLTLFAKEDLGIPVDQAGRVVMVAPLARVLLAYPMGRLADRVNRKTLLSIGNVFLVAVLAGAYAGVQSLWHLYVMLGLFAVGDTLNFLSGASLLMDLIPEGRQGELLGVESSIAGIGGSVGLLLGGVLTDLWGTYRVILAMGSVAMAISYFFVRRIPMPEGKRQWSSIEIEGQNGPS